MSLGPDSFEIGCSLERRAGMDRCTRCKVQRLAIDRASAAATNASVQEIDCRYRYAGLHAVEVALDSYERSMLGRVTRHPCP